MSAPLQRIRCLVKVREWDRDHTIAEVDNYLLPLGKPFLDRGPVFTRNEFTDTRNKFRGRFHPIRLPSGKSMPCTTRDFAASFAHWRDAGRIDPQRIFYAGMEAPFYKGWLDALASDYKTARQKLTRSGRVLTAYNNINTCGFAAASRGSLREFQQEHPGVMQKVRGLELNSLRIEDTDTDILEVVAIDDENDTPQRVYDAVSKGIAVLRDTERILTTGIFKRGDAAYVFETYGDGLSDAAMFAAVKAAGGVTILVGDPNSPKVQQIVQELGYTRDGGLIDVGPFPPDYSENGIMRRVISALNEYSIALADGDDSTPAFFSEQGMTITGAYVLSPETADRFRQNQQQFYESIEVKADAEQTLSHVFNER